MKPRQLAQLLATLGCAFCASAASADSAGRVLVVAGDVTVLRDGKELRLARGAAVESGDTIRTGAVSNAQVRMSDGSIVALRPETEFRLDEYRFNGQQDGSEKGFFSLLKGGFRTISGQIGKRNQANYQVSTPTATMGIRGTDYTVRICAQDCVNTDGTKAKDGVYGGVDDGEIEARNKGGAQRFRRGDSFYVRDMQTGPAGLIARPIFVSDKLAGRARNQGQTSESGRIAPKTPDTKGDALAATTNGGAEAGGEAEAGARTTGTSTNSAKTSASTSTSTLASSSTSTTPTVAASAPAATSLTASTNATSPTSGATSQIVQSTETLPLTAPANLTTGFVVAYAPGSQSAGTGDGVVTGCKGCSNSDMTISGNTLAFYRSTENGSNHSGNAGKKLSDAGGASLDDTNAYWGYWNDGKSSRATTTDHASGQHFIFAGTTPADVIAAKEGAVTYAFVDGTRAYDSDGDVGTKMSGSLSVNFTQRTVTPSITYEVDSDRYAITGFSAPISGNSFSGSGPVSCAGGAACGNGAISQATMKGSFIGTNGNGAMAGVTTSHGGTATSAVGLFKAP